MVLIDPIGDMLTRIRNSIKVKHQSVEMPSSKVKESIAAILKQEGYISNYESLTKGSKKMLKIVLKVNAKGRNAINSIKRASTPGRHIYVAHNKIPRVQSGFGTTVLSTSKGLFPDRVARKEKIGGEVMFYVW